MPDYTKPLPIQDVLNDPNYISGDYEYKNNALDTLETHNLAFLEEQKRLAGGENGPDGAFDYATEVLNYRAGIRNQRYNALMKEGYSRIKQISEIHDSPVEETEKLYGTLARNEPIGDVDQSLLKDVSELQKWHLDQNYEIKKYAQNNSDSPFNHRIVKNAQGVAYAEEKIFTGGDGRTLGVFKFMNDQYGQPDGPTASGAGGGGGYGLGGREPKKQNQSNLIPLNTNVGEEINRLNEEKAKKTDELKKITDELDADRKNPSMDAEGQGFAIAHRQNVADGLAKDLAGIDEKLGKYNDGDRGLSNFLHDQMVDHAMKDPGLRERMPNGSSFGYAFGADMLIGAAQGSQNLAAAANLLIGNKDAAKSLAQEAEMFDMARSAYGMGRARNSTTTGSLLLTTTSDQIPMLLGQMALGKLAAAASTKVMSSVLSKSVSASAAGVSAEAAAAAVAKSSQYWGPKIGAFVGSLPSAAQDAAGNLADIYGESDRLEAQAKTIENPVEREAMLKQAQALEDHAAGIFMGHFVSTAALEYLPAENYLSRFAGDLPLSAKVLRASSKADTAAGRTAEAAQKYEVLQKRGQKFWESKLGIRTVEGLTQGSSEAITEFVQQMSDNTIAKAFYDDNRDITEGIGDATLAGLFLGSAMGFGASVTKRHALVRALNEHTTRQASAQNAVIEQMKQWPGQALKDGTLASPVEEVVKSREDGKWIVDDPTLPADAQVPQEFNTAEEAQRFAADRWENYGKQKLREVYSSTEGATTNTEQQKADLEEVLVAMSAAARGTANGASKETIWKSLSQSVGFKEAPDANATHDSAIPYLDKILGNTPSKLREQLDAHKQQVNEWLNDPEEARGPKPQPSAMLQVGLNFVNGQVSKTNVPVEYPTVDIAHQNIMAAIPTMPSSQIEGEILNTSNKIAKVSAGLSPQQMRNPNGMLYKMYREQKARYDELDKRANQGPKKVTLKEGVQGASPSGVQSPSGGATSVGTGEIALNQGAAPSYGDRVTSLNPNQVFVFGSNPQGFHGAGSAGYASFGEAGNVWRKKGYGEQPSGTQGKWNVKGQGEGLQSGTEGTSYALPTVAKAGAKRSLSPEQITDNIKRMYDTARENPDKEFLVAQDAKGGLNGYSGEEMAKMFVAAGPAPSNVKFNEGFSKLLGKSQEKNLEDPITHFPKEFQQFIKETEAKIAEYNKALMGQPPVEPKKEVNESSTLKEMVGMPAGREADPSYNKDEPMFDPVTGQLSQYFSKKENLPKGGATTEEIAANKSKPAGGATVQEPHPFINFDGTLNVEGFLSKIPEGTPIGDLAALMREVLPLMDAENRTLRFNVSKDAGSSGVKSNEHGQVVVGEGPGSYDTIGQNATVAEILGNMLPKMVDIIIGPKVASVKKSIAGRKPLSRENQKSNWSGGRLTEEAGSPSAEELRAVFEIAMPGAFAVKEGQEPPVRTAQDMKRLVVRAELSRTFNGLVPESNELMDAMADGQASVTPEPPSPSNNTAFHVQKTADGRMIFWEATSRGWRQVPVNRKSFPREQFTDKTTVGKQAALYLRQIVSSGHFDALFGHTVEDAKGKTFYDGTAATPLTKVEYKNKYARQGESVPPWEMTSFSRFLAGMIGNPDFSMSMDKGSGWALPIQARQSTFRAVVGGFLGEDFSVGSIAGHLQEKNDPNVMATVGAALLASNAKRYKENLKNGPAPGLPGPTPIKGTTTEHQARLENEAAVSGFEDKRYQDTTGNEKNVYYDEDGNPQDPHNQDLQTEASDMGQNVRFERRDTRPYTEAQGREDQAEGFSTALSPLQKHLVEQELEGDVSDGLSKEEAAENNARIVEETNSFFALQLAQAEKQGRLKTTRVSPKGERAIGLIIKRMKLDTKTGTGVLGPEASPQAQLTHVLNSDNVTKAEIDKFIKKVQKFLPKGMVDEIASTYFKTQAASVPFQEKRKAAVEGAYQAHKESVGGRRKLTAEEKKSKEAMVEKAKAESLASITPEGFDPSLFVMPSGEMFGDKVDDGGQNRIDQRELQARPIKSAPANEVLLATADGGFTEKDLSDYIRTMPWPRLNMVHNALVQLAKAFGIKLDDKNSYSNSKKEIRIKTDSLETYGSLETALHALNQMANPQQISDYLVNVGFPGNPSVAKVAAMVRTDPSLVSDMHALASGFMDSIAYGLKEQGKRVMTKAEAAVFGYGEKTDENGARQGELQPSEEELAGPYVAMDADSMTEDPANMSLTYPKVYKAAASKSFKLRPTRFSVGGHSPASAIHINGITPFFIKNDGSRVDITGDSVWHALGGRSVNDLFQELAATFHVNADLNALSSLYKDIWRQVFTTSKSGMAALKDMKSQVNATRKDTGTDVPMVSPEVPVTQLLSPARAIAELINDYVPSEQRTAAKPKKQNLSDPVSQAAQEELEPVSDADVGLDQPNLQTVPRAQYSGNKTRLITIFKGGDPTSLLHEMVHWMRGTKLEDGTSLFENALGDTYEAFMEWATEGGKHNPKTKEGYKLVEERIAEGAEEYLRVLSNDDSKATKRFFEKMGANNPTMVVAFKKVANMFRRIYEGLKAFVQLDNRAMKGYDSFFGATEQIIPSYSKQIELTLEQLQLEDVQEKARKLVAAANSMGANVTQAQALDAVTAEEAQEGSELMPTPEDGGPTTPDDPETVLYQTIPSGLGAVPATHAPDSALRVLFRKGQQKFSEWFIATQGMNWEVFNIMQIKLNGKHQTMESQYIKYSRDLEKALNDYIGKPSHYSKLGNLVGTPKDFAKRSDLRGQVHREVNAYLTQKNPGVRARLLASLPTDEIKNAAAAVRVHVDMLSDMIVASGIAQGPLAAAINANKGSYLHRAYEIITDPDRPEKLQNGKLNLLYRSAIKSIMDTRSVPEDVAVKIANRIVETGAAHTQKVGESNQMARGVGVLMREKNPFPDLTVARDLLWGLKEDPIFNYQNTVKQMGHLLSVNAALTDLLRYGTTGPNPLIIPAYQPNSSKTVNFVPFFGATEAVDPKKNPILSHIQTRLAGYKTSQEVADYVREILNNHGVISGQVGAHLVNQLNNLFKLNATVFNWETGMRNFMSSTLTLLGNGHGNPVNWARAIRLVWNQGFGIENTARNAAFFEELQSRNIAESATISELKDFARRYPDADKIYEKFLDGGSDWAKMGDELSREGKKLWTGFKQGSMSLYNGFDVLAKIAAYMGEKDNVKKMYPSLTENEVQEMASKRTHLTMFSFDMNPKLVTVMRTKQPIMAPFTSFVWAMARTGVNIMKMGIDDMKTGTKRTVAGEAGGAAQMAVGAKRLASFGAVASAGEWARAYLMSFFGWEEEDMDSLRKMVNPWDKNGTIIPLGYKYDEKIKYINLSNIMPYSVISDAVMSAFRNEGDAPGQKVKDALSGIWRPFLEEQYIVSFGRAVGDRRDRYGEELESGMEVITEIARPLMFGHIQNVARLNLAAGERPEQQFVGSLQSWLGVDPKPMSWERKALMAAGIRTNAVEKKDLIKWKAQRFLGQIKGASSQFALTAVEKNTYMRSEFDGALENAMVVQAQTLTEANRLFTAFSTGFGVMPEELKDILKQVTERRGHVSGGKFDSDMVDAIVTDGGAVMPVKISKEWKGKIEDVSMDHQPVRILWLDDAEQDGRLEVTEGR